MPDAVFPAAGSGRRIVMGEVAQAHDGSLGMAHAFVDMVADAGADAVKFQTHIAAAESTPAEPWRVRFSPQDETRYEYWRRMEFTEEQWRGLKRHADERGILFLCSPFSLEALELLERVGVAAWKVASGETTSPELLERMAASGRPVLVSTGMSRLDEIDAAVDRVRRVGADVTVMQCTSAYPCPPERTGLNLVPFFRERYGCRVGLSDHSGTIYPGLAAVTLGAEVVEVHVTFSPRMYGPDVPASLAPDDFERLVAGVRFLEAALGNPVDKDAVAEELTDLRGLFTKSVVAARNLDPGAVLRSEDLVAKKPGTGIPAVRLDDVIGRRLRRPVAADALLTEDDLE